MCTRKSCLVREEQGQRLSLVAEHLRIGGVQHVRCVVECKEHSTIKRAAYKLGWFSDQAEGKSSSIELVQIELVRQCGSLQSLPSQSALDCPFNLTFNPINEAS